MMPIFLVIDCFAPRVSVILFFFFAPRVSVLPDSKIHQEIMSTGSTGCFELVFNAQFHFHVNELCRTAFYHIRNISRIRPCLSVKSTKTLVHALVTSRLDHCNALLYGLPYYLIQRLQYLMNAAAKVIICKRKFDHVTPLLIELHWLPVRQRIVFKILRYTFKALHGVTPMYLTELMSPYIPRRALRSADQLLLEQPTHKLKSLHP